MPQSPRWRVGLVCAKDAKLSCRGNKARRSLDIADYPNPDLGIEIDMSPPKIDRPAIYAALKVAEIWRFDGEHQQLFIERLEDDGTYRTVDRSSFLPLYAAEIRRWVVGEDSHDESVWARRLRARVRAELAPRLPLRAGAVFFALS
ncbi:MAG: Uma2 family endonuclease [Isosphaeraceae bacterium]